MRSPTRIAFLDEMSGRFSDSASAARKLWKTSPPGMRRTMEALMRPRTGLARLSEIEYLVEAVDPKHRTISRVVIMSWAESGSMLDIATWLDGRGTGSSSADGGYTTEYMTDERREEYRLQFESPAILKQDETPLVGDNIFVLSADGVFYGGSKTKGSNLSVHHSSFMAGKAVQGAGHLFTTGGGELYKIDDRSGHYAPTKEHFVQVLLKLAGMGFPLKAIQFHFDGKLQTAQSWLDQALPTEASPFEAFEEFEAFEAFEAFDAFEEANVS